MKVRRGIRIAMLGLLVLAGARLRYAFYRFYVVESKFDSVHVGQTKQDVLQRLGRPTDHSGDCLVDLRIAKDCASELVYSYPFAPLVPEYYVVDFSGDGRVAGVEHLISP
jgi:hypothetical protein